MLERVDAPAPITNQNETPVVNTINPTEDDANTGCFATTWNAITGLFSDIASFFGDVAKAIGTGIIFGVVLLWSAGAALWRYVLGPAALTLINVGGYFLDKVLFGSPALRPYLHDGILGSEFPQVWRDFVQSNAGWDIYSSMNPVLDNIFGVLGLGMGVCNIFNHLFTSYCYNVYNFAHLLGSYGVFGEQKYREDRRGGFLQGLFAVLSLPAVLPTVIFTNLCDVTFTFIKNTWQSFKCNFRWSSHFLGEHGAFGARSEYKDDRHPALRWIFGFFSSPLVVPLSLFTNAVDCALTFIYHFFTSYWRNLRPTFNIVLREHGVFGEHLVYEDDRHWGVKIPFFIFSFVPALATAVVTNVIDLLCTFVKKFASFLDEYVRPYLGDSFKNFGLSFYRNLRCVFNLLGEHGVLGPRKTYADDRSKFTRGLFFVLSFPCVLVAAIGTNIIDLFLSFWRSFFKSFGQNINPIFNLVLGPHGQFGERREWSYGDRWIPTVIAYGFVSAFPVLMGAILTNVTDILVTFAKQCWKSFKNNLNWTFNIVLREHGVFGPHRPFKDKRYDESKWVPLIAYGFITAPLVGVAALFTNLADCFLRGLVNFFKSWGHNLHWSFNIILGDYGVFGKRRSYNDKRWLPTRLFFGGLAFAPVLICAVITNVIDLVASYFKHAKHTILMPALIGTGIVVGVLTAPPAFVIRKVVKGLYNCLIRPFVDCARANPFNGTRLLKGIANTVTLGLFSACKKLFKAATGYTDRFGFPLYRSDEYKTNHFNDVQERFREGIHAAATGKFPGVKDGKAHFRMIMRIFYGLRHKVEDVTKKFHDAYLDYARALNVANTPRSDERYNMFHFFQSDQYKQREMSVRAGLKPDQYTIEDNVQGFLSATRA